MDQRIVVLASGRGSNFCALADATAAGLLGTAKIVALVVDRSDAGALAEAEKRSIPAHIVSRKEHPDKQSFEKALADTVEACRPTWICLAGFLRILGKEFLGRWPNRVVNIHPSFLPAFPGLDAQAQAIAAGVPWSGCTVHLVTETLDAGPIVDQSRCPVEKGDTAAAFAARLLPLEHATYVRAMARLLLQPFQVVDGKIDWKA